MRCPLCVEQETPSRLYGGGGFSCTSMCIDTYYDEQGVRHYHDPNSATESLTCSNGHRILSIRSSRCAAPNCDWNRTDDSHINVYDANNKVLGTFTLEGVRIPEEK